VIFELLVLFYIIHRDEQLRVLLMLQINRKLKRNCLITCRQRTLSSLGSSENRRISDSLVCIPLCRVVHL